MKNIFKTLIVFTLVTMFVSCKKEQAKYQFTVTVISETGFPVQNVFIEAGAPIPESIPDFKGVTNLAGQISFTYDYEAVLQIVATRGTNPPSYIGCGYVKLEADRNVPITVVLQPYDPSQQGC